MAPGGHFGWPKITFDCISPYLGSIRNFYIFFRKMTPGGHFGWPKITFDRISRHFRSIRNFNFFRHFFHKMAPGGHFRWPKITFDCISRYFGSIRNLYIFFAKWNPAAILDDRKSLSIAFLTISDQYTTFIFWKFFTKWSPVTILDDRKSLSIAFLDISDQYTIFFKMFSQNDRQLPFWMKITFDGISRHFRSIRNFLFFTKWLPVAILDDRKSLLIAFLAISDQYATFILFYFHFGSPIWAILDYRKSRLITFLAISDQYTIGSFHYMLSMAMPNMKLIGEFMTKLETQQAFWAFLYKMAARSHFVFPIDGYGLYKRWRAAAAETAAVQPKT